MENGNLEEVPGSDLPPGLSEMFINSTDTLRHREINEAIPNTWNDRPPLFYVGRRRRDFLWRRDRGSPEAENADDVKQEDPNLLKGVSNAENLVSFFFLNRMAVSSLNNVICDSVWCDLIAKDGTEGDPPIPSLRRVAIQHHSILSCRPRLVEVTRI